MIQNNKTVFLFWDTGEEQMPLFHKMNIENIRKRLVSSGWEIIVTSLNKKSPWYIEILINLPNYFFDLPRKITDIKGLAGNQSDIIRLRLLEKYGGCYFDTSTILLCDSIENISLYGVLQKNRDATLAGYTNYTFTRKDDYGRNYFLNAKDGMELGILFAKQNSQFLSTLNNEIDKYWNWKKKYLVYSDYPLFIKSNLTKVSLLNEYHIHYAIFQMLLTVDVSLLSHLATQSSHMLGKENAFADGPYSIQDRFCRGETRYESASPQKLLQALLPGNMTTYNGKITTLSDRIKIFMLSDLLSLPGYLRVGVENYFKRREDYIMSFAFSSFYNLW